MRKLNEDKSVVFFENGLKNMKIELLKVGKIEDLRKAVCYWGGNSRWTGTLGKVAVDGASILVECDLSKGRSSDPLGKKKNAKSHALDELIMYINKGVHTKGKGQIIPASKTVVKAITVGVDLSETEELEWVSF